MIQPQLFDWVPPSIHRDSDGSTFERVRDGKRLNAQASRVYLCMSDGVWRSLAQIAAVTGDPEASISARLRDMRKAGRTVERRYVERGLHEYRVTW